MSIDSIVFVLEKPNKSGNGKVKQFDHHNHAKVDPATGERLVYGNGCHYWDNCFDCPFPPDKCYFDYSNSRKMSIANMRRTGINPISDKQKIEIQKRRVLKAVLIAEYGEHCMTCGDKYRDFRGISLSHIIPLARGGKTTRDNCLLECLPCHEKYEGHPERRPQK